MKNVLALALCVAILSSCSFKKEPQDFIGKYEFINSKAQSVSGSYNTGVKIWPVNSFKEHYTQYYPVRLEIFETQNGLISGTLTFPATSQTFDLENIRMDNDTLKFQGDAKIATFNALLTQNEDGVWLGYENEKPILSRGLKYVLDSANFRENERYTFFRSIPQFDYKLANDTTVSNLIAKHQKAIETNKLKKAEVNLKKAIIKKLEELQSI